ncbi:hypothetical protein G7054_g5836 [Neopestalotiopsis clavispora]|nr:hypothetical protein G7054_g5836 [Neopestalotiopsis clavispora]
MADAAAHLPPPSASLINLAIAEIVIYVVLLPPVLWITWKHGKDGMTCWSILVAFYGMRFASDIWQIMSRNEPNIPGALIIITNAGSIACLTLALIGILYETNNSLPYPNRWIDKITMAATNLINTAGIALATYGGAPSNTGGVLNLTLDRLGNILMLLVIFALYVWILPTWHRVWSVRNDPSFKPAMYMTIAAGAAMPFQLIRIVYNTVYSFELADDALNPIMGIFATRFIFLFVTQLGCTLVLLGGGYLGIPRRKSGSVDDSLAESGVQLTTTGETTDQSPEWGPSAGRMNPKKRWAAGSRLR